MPCVKLTYNFTHLTITKFFVFHKCDLLSDTQYY